MSTKEIGSLGERIAENYLKSKGYQILDRNYSFRISGPSKGEIDIVAKKGETISFVEVKLLRNPRVTSPEQKVDFLKQKKIMKTAQGWLMTNKMPLDTKWQIDVLAIEIDSQNKKAKIRHLKNAVISC